MRQHGCRVVVLAASRAAAACFRRSPGLHPAGAETLSAASAASAVSRASFHSSAPEQAPAASAQEATDTILFPREGPGVSYALNWALAGAGVTPAGTVSRNLKPSKLATISKGAPVSAKSGSKILIAGSQGATALAPPAFRRALREVTSQLSALPSLYVHDGTVGSSSASDARTRVISDAPAAAAALARLLAPTPTRAVSSSSFPITLYAVPSYKNDALGAGGFIAADLSSSLVIAAGSAVGDGAALKAVLLAAAAGPILRRGAVPLPGRLVAPGGAKPFLVVAPTAAGETLLATSAAWPEPGFIWSAANVARPFPASASSPSQYSPPSALVLLTSDSSGAIPGYLSLSPQQAAFYLLAGYDGAGFHPGFARSDFSLGSSDPAALSQALAGLITKTSTPTYLVNAHGQPDLGKYITSVASGVAAAGKPASDDAVTQLNTKLTEFVRTRFPNVPEDIAP